MSQEDKELLLKDLCARLPYGLYVQVEREPSPIHLNYNDAHFENYFNSILNGDIKPYLRPMSNMTEEEKEELYEVSGLICYDGLFTCKKLAKKQSFIADTTDWLNTHHFDYRGLIEKGLAFEALEGMYKTKL